MESIVFSAVSSGTAGLAVTDAELDVVKYLCSIHAPEDLKGTLDAIATAAEHLAACSRAVMLRHTSGLSFASDCFLQVKQEIGDLLVDERPLVLYRDTANDQKLRHLWELCGAEINVLVVTPIRSEASLLGILLLEFQSALRADPAENPALAVLIDQAASAIRKAVVAADLRRNLANLSALVDLDQTLVPTYRFEEMLAFVIEHVQHLIDAEMGGFLLYEPQTNELIMQKPALGASDQAIKIVRFPIDHPTPAADVFRTGKVYLSNDIVNDIPNDPVGLKLAAKFRIRSLLEAPVDVGNRRIGVFILANKRSGDFDENDARLVTLLAAHLGSQLQAAQLLDVEHQAVGKLQELNAVIDQQREELQRAQLIHDEFTSIVLGGNDLDALCTTVGRLVANYVAVEDCFGSVLATVGPDLASHNSHDENGDSYREWHRCIEDEGTLSAMRGDPAINLQLRRDRRPIRIAPAPHLGMTYSAVVAPVVIGSEILAYIWVMESNRSLDQFDFTIVERAAVAVALHFAKEKAATEARYKLRADFVAALLGERHDPDEVTVRRAAYLGIDLNMPRTVVVVGTADSSGSLPEERIVAVKAKLLQVVERSCRRSDPQAIVSPVGDEIIVLAHGSTGNAGDHVSELRKLGTDIVAEAGYWLPEISISLGIGSRCHKLADYARSHQQAHRVLQALRISGQSTRVMAYNELGIYDLLFDPDNHDRVVTFVQNTIGTLLEYDRHYRTELTETLRQFSLNDSHHVRTAEALNIHLTTLRYRLRRIEELIGIDLHDGEAKFKVQLAVRLSRIQGVV